MLIGSLVILQAASRKSFPRKFSVLSHERTVCPVIIEPCHTIVQTLVCGSTTVQSCWENSVSSYLRGQQLRRVGKVHRHLWVAMTQYILIYCRALVQSLGLLILALSVTKRAKHDKITEWGQIKNQANLDKCAVFVERLSHVRALEFLVQCVFSFCKISSETVVDKTKGTRQTGTQHNTTSQQHQTVFDQRATQLQYVSMVTYFILFSRPASVAGGYETRFVAPCRELNHPTELFRATNSLGTPRHKKSP